MGLKQVIFGKNGRDPSHINLYANGRGFFTGGGGGAGRQQFSCSHIATIKNFHVILRGSGPPGMGNSLTYKIQYNVTNLIGGNTGWVDSGITITIADTATSGSDTTHTVLTSVGDTMYRIIRSSVGVDLESAIAQEEWSFTVEALDNVSSLYAIWTQNQGTFTPTKSYACPFSWPNNDFPFQPSSTDTSHYDTVPTPGMIVRQDVFVSVAPLSGSYYFGWVVDDILQDGTGGTVDTVLTMTGSGTHGFKTFALPLATQQKCQWAAWSTANPTSALQVWGSCSFQATTPFRYCFTGNTANSHPVADGHFAGTIDSNDAAWPYPQSAVYITCGIDPYTIEGFLVNLTQAPGAAASLTFATQKNDVDGSMTLTIADLATQGIDATHSDAYVSGDRFNLHATGAGSFSAGNDMNWSAAMVSPGELPPTPVTYAMRRLRRFPLPETAQ